ncbi:MAG: DUF58 domain-containing protein [Caldilinea sp.]|nr:DUF58 domain-containing protein [Caldilinea sp.]MCB9117250.1 DUF58 domain-containing protein [Caldilineaceae bacterium]MCB9121708.1 DUF58 domain-containing protein [Caldilineaceae bacterium]MCB9125625.1 DUF58 domain-containing protein [Caldilineaceae bacterium]MCO5211203.1 DUF58 domain-containing protein [Caldilinea sp.]
MNSRLLFLIIGAVAAWIIAFNTGRDLAFSIAYLLSGVIVLSYGWAWNSVRGVTARRRTRSRRSQVGQYVEEQFEVTNRTFLPKLWLEIDDFSTLPWHSASRVVSAVRRNGTQRWLVKTLCTQRGRFRLGPVTLRSGDPLGIFRRERPLSGTGFVVVYPPTFELTSFEPSISELSGGEARHRRTYQVTTNVAGVREYVTGDGFNRIHWPTTARARRLMVKEFELDPTADVWIYLDLCSSAAAELAWTPQPPESPIFASPLRMRARGKLDLPPSTTEYGVTIAASLARYFILRNRAVGMNSRGRTREFVQSDRGERQLHKFFEALAVVEAAGNLPFANLIATDGIRLNRNDTLLAVTPDASPEWAAALQMLQRRGVNSIALIIDATTFGSRRDYSRVQSELMASGIPTYRIRQNDPLDKVLSAAPNGFTAN